MCCVVCRRHKANVNRGLHRSGPRAPCPERGHNSTEATGESSWRNFEIRASSSRANQPADVDVNHRSAGHGLTISTADPDALFRRRSEYLRGGVYTRLHSRIRGHGLAEFHAGYRPARFCWIDYEVPYHLALCACYSAWLDGTGVRGEGLLNARKDSLRRIALSRCCNNVWLLAVELRREKKFHPFN